MAERIEIKCVNKADRYNPYERIEYVGGINPGGARWRLSQQQAIEGSESGRWSFYVVGRAGVPVDVIVEKSAAGHKYLTTKPDGVTQNNLLSLPECPR